MMSTPISATFGNRAVAALSVPSGVKARGWIWYITPLVTQSGDGLACRSLSGSAGAAWIARRQREQCGHPDQCFLHSMTLSFAMVRNVCRRPRYSEDGDTGNEAR